MASAGGDGGSNGDAGRRQGQRITIPLPRPLQPGQRVMVRMVPAVQVPGANGVRMVRPAHAHVHVVNTRQHQQQSQQAQHLQRQQQELQQQLDRARREENERKEDLKQKLTFSHPPEVEYTEGDDAVLSWKPVQEGTSDQPTYNTLMYKDSKPESREIHKGYECSCSVSEDVLLPGHNFEFAVRASVGNVTGEESPRCSLQIPARPPAKPLPPKVGSRTKGSLTLRWNAPQDNGSPITGYELDWDQCKGEWDKLFSDKTKQYKFNHRFLPSSFAEFRIRASNDVGWSEYSDSLTFSAGAGAPSQPNKPFIIGSGPTFINVGWCAPNGNGAEVTCYKLEREDTEFGHGFMTEYHGPDLSHNTTNLDPNTLYKFRVSAQNEKGWSQLSPVIVAGTVASPSGPPGSPYLKERATPTSLYISWAAPKNTGGADVQSYVLQMDAGVGVGGEESGELVDVYTGPESSCLMEGLLPGRKFQCQVCAVTEAGRGKWSPIVHLRTPATRPSPTPSLCIVGQPAKTSVKIEWGYPLSDGGSAIISYTIECKHTCNSSSSNSWHAVATVADPQTFSGHSPTSPPPSLSHAVTQLLPGEEYVFRVHCQNAIGPSHPSMECTCVTAPGEPDPPPGLEVMSLAATSVQLKWKEPISHGCVTESYEVQCTACGGVEGEGKMTTLSVVGLNCSVANLQPATQYQARVKALSAAGPSDWSVLITFTTSPSTPSPPTHLTMVSRTSYSLLIAWATPDGNGSPLTAYHVEHSSGHTAGHTIEVSSLETQYTLVDLHPSTSYRYRIRAENVIGKGSFGPYGTNTTLPPPPSPPLITLSSCSHHTLKLAWGKKTNRAISYILQVASQGRRFHEAYNGNAVGHRLTRLQSDTEYVMRIAAVSESGQGVWSDDVSFVTTPTPPPTPTNLQLRQESNDTMMLTWQPGGDYPHSLKYEVQHKSPSPAQDFSQAYKGSNTDCTLPVTAYDKPHQARVRCWTVCAVNGREEQIWSGYSTIVHCQCVQEATKEEEEATDSHDGEEVSSKALKPAVSPRVKAMLLVVAVSLLTLLLAFLMGQYAM